MGELPDLSGYVALSEEQARLKVHLAVLAELRYLRWAPWRKGQTVESVLRQHGVELFAGNVVRHLVGGKTIILQPAQPLVTTSPFAPIREA